MPPPAMRPIVPRAGGAGIGRGAGDHPGGGWSPAPEAEHRSLRRHARSPAHQRRDVMTSQSLKILRMLARLHPELWEIIHPHEPAIAVRVRARGEEVALNPQPLPP